MSQGTGVKACHSFGKKTQESVEQHASVSLFLDVHCNLGESPVYDTRNDVLYFVDINENEVHAVGCGQGVEKSHKVYRLDEPVGCVFLTTDVHRVGVATTRRILLMNLGDCETVSIEEVGVLPEGIGKEPGMRFNDGKVVPRGTHLIVGHMDSKWREGNPGKLYAWSVSTKMFQDITPDGGIGLPNGMVWTKDATVFMIVDSCAETITSYKTNNDGIPRSREQVISSAPTGHAHVPDGMTLDSHGNLWVALGESGSVVCYDGKSGKELQRILLPIRRPTSCNFGGPGLETLFVTSRVETGDNASPNHGGVFAVNIPEVSGSMPDAMLDIAALS